jgi:predicted PurR-regulated permease PerM
VGERLVSWWQSLDQQGAALLASVKPYLGQVGNWLLARSAQIGSGVLELTLSLVFVFFFYRDGPRLAALRLLHCTADGRACRVLPELVAGTVQRVVNGVIGTAAARGCWR